MRVGRYEDAAEANRKAIKVDDEYVKKQPAQAFYLMYKAHNFQFLWAAAMMEGRSAEAIQATKDMIATVPPPMMDMTINAEPSLRSASSSPSTPTAKMVGNMMDMKKLVTISM